MLTPEQFDNWIAALRSNKFHQGQFYLKTKDAVTNIDYYCCMGVLEELIDPNQWTGYNISYGYCYQNKEGKKGFLDEELLPKDIQLLCSNWNDDKLFTFSQIADKIQGLRDQIVQNHI